MASENPFTFPVDEIVAQAKRGGHGKQELEARFSNIQRGAFNRLHGMMMEKTHQMVGSISTKDTIKGSVRKTHTVINGDDVVLYIEKQRLWYQDNGHGVRIAFSREVNLGYVRGKYVDRSLPIDATPDEIKGKETERRFGKMKGPELDRSKLRWSFPIPMVKCRVDMTQVTTSYGKEKPTGNLEVEVEFTGTDEEMKVTAHIKKMAEFCAFLLKTLQNSDILYTITEKKALCKTFNRILCESDEETKLLHYYLAQARNLKKRDIVWGGLIGGKYQQTVTPKAHGLRKSLLFDATGIWLVFPPYEFCLLTTECPPILYGTAIDGEDIPPAARLRLQFAKNAAKHYFIPFDMLAWKGSKDCQQLAHLKRIDLALSVKKIFDEKPNPLIQLGTKPFILLDSVERLHTAIGELDKTPYTFQTDGYMFTTNNAPYISTCVIKDKQTGNEKTIRVDQLRLNKRNLTEYPDVCKLKPIHELTIDFKIRTSAVGDVASSLLVNENGRLVTFMGTLFNPFDFATQVDWENKMIQDVSHDTVIEFGPMIRPVVQSAGSLDQILYLTPIRIRNDKTEPNRKEIAEDIWDDINNPIDKATLEGKTFELLFYYHNNIKRKLWKQIPEGSNVIDIGAGQGGDISKARHLNRILAIEPNAQHVTELRRRLQLNKGMSEKYQIEVCGGEATEQIVEAAKAWFWADKTEPIRPLYITAMLSLSFFWSSPKMLQGLANTIQAIAAAAVSQKPLRFIFLTIEGREVERLFSVAKTDDLAIGPAALRLEKPNTLKIHIDGTIVNQQTEYLVYLEELYKIAGMTNVHTFPATEERLLSADEMKFTSLYVYGDAEILFPVAIENVVAAGNQFIENSEPSLAIIKKSFNHPMAGKDDDVEDLGQIDNLYIGRIASLTQGGGSLFHSLAKLLQPHYKRTFGPKERMSRCVRFKRDVVWSLTREDPFMSIEEFKDADFYEDVYKGKDPEDGMIGKEIYGCHVPINALYFTYKSGYLYKTFKDYVFDGKAKGMESCLYMLVNDASDSLEYLSFAAQVLGYNILVCRKSAEHGLPLQVIKAINVPERNNPGPSEKAKNVFLLEHDDGKVVYEPIFFRREDDTIMTVLRDEEVPNLIRMDYDIDQLIPYLKIHDVDHETDPEDPKITDELRYYYEAYIILLQMRNSLSCPAPKT